MSISAAGTSAHACSTPSPWVIRLARVGVAVQPRGGAWGESEPSKVVAKQSRGQQQGTYGCMGCGQMGQRTGLIWSTSKAGGADQDMMGRRIGLSRTSEPPLPGGASPSHVPCIPSFYPHMHGDRDMWAVSDSTAGRIHVVKKGHGVGLFTDPWDAALQTDGFSHSSKDSYKRWDLARDSWDDFCLAKYRGGCPAPLLAKGFHSAYPTPARDRPAPPALPMAQPSPAVAAAQVPCETTPTL
ncbi:hypothetical protein DFH09DRAFT_1081098 [Mycena vulgaris]|nr:hypothetical protein DFH09DRAFT_1081098 [Mycena vulgaris]